MYVFVYSIILIIELSAANKELTKKLLFIHENVDRSSMWNVLVSWDTNTMVRTQSILIILHIIIFIEMLRQEAQNGDDVFTNQSESFTNQSKKGSLYKWKYWPFLQYHNRMLS